MIHEPDGLWTISGPSGSGKSTLIAGLRKVFPHARKFKSVCTRQMRNGETSENSEYDFISLARFQSLSQQQSLLWDKEVHGNRYGAPYKVVHEALADGKFVIADIAYYTSEILMRYAETIDKAHRVHCIYLDITDEIELRRRLAERNEADLERRIMECRPWSSGVRGSFLPFKIIDARMPVRAVYEEGLKYLCNS